MRGNIHSTSPDAYIVAFPFKKELTKVGKKFSKTDLDTKEPIIIDKDILSISTNKGKGGIGSWSAILGSSRNYKALLHSGCWAVIYIRDEIFSDKEKSEGGNDKSCGMKMIGMIKSLRVNESTGGDGTRSIRYEIAGDDFHSLFESKIYINSLFRVKDGDGKVGNNSAYYLFGDKFKEVFNTDAKGKDRLNNPGQLASKLLEASLGRDVGARSNPNISVKDDGEVPLGGSIGLPPALSSRIGGSSNIKSNFYDVIKQFIQSELAGKIATHPAIGDQFTIWSLIKTYSNQVMNEVYTDLVVDDGKIVPAFVCRAIPFSPFSSMSALIKTAEGNQGLKTIHDEDKSINLIVGKDLHEHEIVNLNYGKSDGERFNFFWITSSLSQSPKTQADSYVNRIAGGNIQNVADSASIGRYGLRPYITSSPYIISDEKTLKIVNIIVRNLWSSAHLFENGTVTIVGSYDHIAVGTNLKFVDRGWVAHIEGVSNSFSVSANGDKSYYTTLTFVRLQTDNGQPIDLIESNKTSQKDYDRGVTHSDGGEE